MGTRHADGVEKDLALRQRPLAELLQWLAARHARGVKVDQEHAAARGSVAVVDRRVQRCRLRNRPVRHPRRLLAVDDVLVPVAPGDAIGFLQARPVRARVHVEDVAAMIRFGDGPAADLGDRKGRHQVRVLRHLRQHCREFGGAETDGESRIPPTEFFRDHRAEPGNLHRGEVGVAAGEQTDAQFVPLAVDVPEDGVPRDHRLRGQPVQRMPGGAHDVARKRVHEVANRPLVLAQVVLDAVRNHVRSPFRVVCTAMVWMATRSALFTAFGVMSTRSRLVSKGRVQFRPLPHPRPLPEMATGEEQEESRECPEQGFPPP